MKQLCLNKSILGGFRMHLLQKVFAIAAALICVLAAGSFLAACGVDPVETQETQPTAVPTESLIPTESIPTVPTTEPTIETTSPATEPPQTEPEPTEPEPTEPPKTFVKEESPAYQKLLTLPNAEDFLCNRFEVNELAVFAEWIDSLEGITDTYSGQWYLKHYGDDGAGLVCHTPLEEDNSCDYIKFTLWYGGDIITDPSTGRRYFTDIPREDVARLVYGADDPIGVDNSIKELFIDYILYCDTFAWSILDPTFRSEWHYEIVTMWPYPKLEPDNHYDQLRLCVDVWRPGMAEDDRYHFWLIYDEDWNQVGLGYQVEGDYHKMVLTGVISED